MDFEILNGLDSNEIKSLLKSNRFKWEDRKNITASLAMKSIEEMLPVILSVVAASAIMSSMTISMKESASKSS